jgi:hypothetical protein
MMSSCLSLLWFTYKNYRRRLLNLNRMILDFDTGRLPKFPAPSSTPSTASGEPRPVGPTPPDATRCPTHRRCLVARCCPHRPTPGSPTPFSQRPCRPPSPDAVLVPSRPVRWATAAPPHLSRLHSYGAHESIPWFVIKMQTEPEKHGTFVRSILYRFGTDVFFLWYG